MKNSRSLLETLAALGAGATLLVGCADAAPPAQSPVESKEVPAATSPATPAAPEVPAAAATPAAPATPAAAATPAAPAAAAGTAKAAAKPMPAKIKNSKRVANKSAEGCCGEGTCAPC
jgi:PBP1b-binding outer membrane lipoprotein LpoB